MDKWIPPALIVYILIAIFFPWILLITAIIVAIWFLFILYFYLKPPSPYMSIDNEGITINWFTAKKFRKTELIYQISDKSEPAHTLFPSKVIHDETTGNFYLYSEKITEFRPGSKYFYRIVETQDNGTQKVLYGGDEYYFQGYYLGKNSSHDERPDELTVGVFGDMQPRTLNPPLFQWQIIKSFKQYDCDLILYLGDHTMYGINPFQWRWLYHILGPVSKNTPILGVVGNHDLKVASEEEKNDPARRGLYYRTYVNYPGNKMYYGVNVNNLHVLAFDFQNHLTKESEEYKFMMKELENHRASDHLVCIWHVSPYTTMNPSSKVQQIRDLIIPKVKEKGGRIWFGGHEHAYQHFEADDIHYITSAATSSFHKHWHTEEYMVKLIMKMHFVIARFSRRDSKTINLKAISKKNKLLDEFNIK